MESAAEAFRFPFHSAAAGCPPKHPGGSDSPDFHRLTAGKDRRNFNERLKAMTDYREFAESAGIRGGQGHTDAETAETGIYMAVGLGLAGLIGLAYALAAMLA